MAVIPLIDTGRLRLRPHRASDHGAAIDLWQRPEVYRFIGGSPLSAQEVWLRLLRYSGLWDVLGYGYWAVELRASGDYIGQLGFADFRRGLVGFDGRYPEAGWVIHPNHAGHGFASEGMVAACAWLDAQRAHPRSFCLIDAANGASLRVAGKLGYRHALDTDFGDARTGVFFRSTASPGPGNGNADHAA